MITKTRKNVSSDVYITLDGRLKQTMNSMFNVNK